MKNQFTAECGLCETMKPRCVTVAVRGTNAWGDREVRVMDLCEDCRKKCRSLYRVHPKHK